MACSWDTTANKCMKGCEVRSQTDCASWTQCEYNPSLSKCNRKCGFKYGAQQTCDGDSLCMWDVTSGDGVCVRNCGLFVLAEYSGKTTSDVATMCSSASMCVWDADTATTGICKKKCMYRQFSEALCEYEVDCMWNPIPVSYTHLRAHETPEHLVCRLLLEKKKKKSIPTIPS
eukprot:TRINITY_DN2920_c0_g1_i15.p2 TRINITY_DN2920_c0_g1~~TRINITY_DN2920_c0_g1_i15.p2  ORF type:complete len:173 (-),score=54.06 TRINITY_DN2920_c0_g1_i15:31-549(-)